MAGESQCANGQLRLAAQDVGSVRRGSHAHADAAGRLAPLLLVLLLVLVALQASKEGRQWGDGNISVQRHQRLCSPPARPLGSLSSRAATLLTILPLPLAAINKPYKRSLQQMPGAGPPTFMRSSAAVSWSPAACFSCASAKQRRYAACSRLACARSSCILGGCARQSEGVAGEKQACWLSKTQLQQHTVALRSEAFNTLHLMLLHAQQPHTSKMLWLRW